MRFASFALISLFCTFSFAEEVARPRVSMEQTPLSEESGSGAAEKASPAVGQARLRVSMEQNPSGDIKELVDRIAENCERSDLDGFLDCFSKSKRSTMRKESRKLFSEHKVRMTVISVETLLVEDDQTNVRLEYIWDVDMTPAKKITSNAVVKMEDGSWRVHSEKILSSRLKDESPSNLAFDFGALNDGLPADIGRHNKGECANGQCGVQRRIAPERVVMQPVPGDGLPADIGRHQIGQCANGQCGVPR